VERIHAAAYLAGFISRAAYIQVSHTRNVFDELVDDFYEYCADHTPEDPELKLGPASAPTHIVFYAQFQALMYMFNRRFCEDVGIADDKREQWDKIQKIVNSYLCPFRFCSPSIVAEFRRRTTELDLLDPYDDGDAPGEHATPGLDDLFYIPFEPMPLPRCADFFSDPKLYLNITSVNSQLDFDDFISGNELRPPSYYNSRDKSPALNSLTTPLRTPLTGPTSFYSEIEPLCLP
jgi:hypothetical protein